jgi:hypothetical protein
MLLRSEVPDQISHLCFPHATCKSKSQTSTDIRLLQDASCFTRKPCHLISATNNSGFHSERTTSWPSSTVVTHSLSGETTSDPGLNEALTSSWIMANVGGQTKKSVIMGLFNASSAAGNIIGPLLFKPEDAPRYAPGVLAVMAIFIALIFLIGLQVVLLFLYNKQRQRQRVAAGKPKFIHDTSMDGKYRTYGEDEGTEGLGENGVNDITDVKNNEFVYVY